MVKIINPWNDLFYDLVKESKNTIKIMSPFIKQNICDEVIKRKRKSTEIKLITSFKLSSLYNGALDLNGLENLLRLDNSEIKSNLSLHAKVYIFDDKKVIISSGNMTNNGLVKNYEYGILITENQIVLDIIKDFDILFADQRTNEISQKNIDVVRKIISNISKNGIIEFPNYLINNSLDDMEICVKDYSLISNKLSGWKKEVFIILNRINKRDFVLNDVYSFANELSKIHPKNKSINEKIRQQLQYLRNLGLVQFIDNNGHYRKLW